MSQRKPSLLDKIAERNLASFDWTNRQGDRHLVVMWGPDVGEHKCSSHSHRTMRSGGFPRLSYHRATLKGWQYRTSYEKTIARSLKSPKGSHLMTHPHGDRIAVSILRKVLEDIPEWALKVIRKFKTGDRSKVAHMLWNCIHPSERGSETPPSNLKDIENRILNDTVFMANMYQWAQNFGKCHNIWMLFHMKERKAFKKMFKNVHGMYRNQIKDYCRSPQRYNPQEVDKLGRRRLRSLWVNLDTHYREQDIYKEFAKRPSPHNITQIVMSAYNTIMMRDMSLQQRKKIGQLLRLPYEQTLTLDSVRMAQDHDENVDWTQWRTAAEVQAYHDRMIAERNARWERIDAERLQQRIQHESRMDSLEFPDSILDNLPEQVRYLADAKALAAEGRNQNHCVRMYTLDAYAGKLFHYNISINQETATLQITKDYEVCQCYGPMNQRISPDMARLVKGLLQSKNPMVNYDHALKPFIRR